MRYFVVLISAAVLVAGCGKKAAEKAVEKSIEESGGDAKVNIGENSVTIEARDGTLKVASGDAAKLPASFPKDIFIYKGAKLQTAMEMPQGFNLVFETGDDMARVQAAYQSSMTSKGWSKEMSMDMGAHKMLAFKKDTRTCNIVIASEAGKTQFTLVVTSEE